jgi:hypothetical protein
MIQLPDLFEQKLANSPSLAMAVRKSFELFEPWLEQSGMPFFPGFTDHSPRHINDVLQTAASIVSDKSQELLSPEDVAVLCMAVLLHDCGMHITQDIFRTLVEKSGPPIVSGLGDLPWAQLWKDFLSEAHRFGQDKLVAVFGDAQPIHVHSLDLSDLSERDCLLIGEFIRRHHARFAHEVALEGVPATTMNRLELVGLEPDVRDLAGLIARSHGMSIRSTLDYVGLTYGLVSEYRKIKPPFLMAVLRIADYIQVKSERALKSLLSVKELRSPVSRQEWRAHFAVRDVSTRHDDPEAIYVHAAPADVRTFLKLEGLFKDIQRELDDSWATLGEVYGRRGDLSSLGLMIRRIRSNLDDRENFARTVPYIPTRAAFDVSGPDLLKLLVGPLYNYDFTIGIRELVQNAVDACRERIDLGLDTSDARKKEGSDVVVNIQELEDGTGWITVTDLGVGMTLETVRRYFLVAGASFRNSDLWKAQHVDEYEGVRVLRGGRFGVGVLAAFLLGDEIEVRTRHITRPESEGIEFKATMADSAIELRRCKLPAGTSIKVKISNPKVFSELRPRRAFHDESGTTTLKNWGEVDWFAQATPTVLYIWDGYDQSPDTALGTPERRRIEGRPQGDLVPLLGESNPNWHVLEDSTPYKGVLWRYSNLVRDEDGELEFDFFSPEVTVNGMRVRGSAYRSNASQLEIPEDAVQPGPEYSIERPSLAIFDPAAQCPINLQRSYVAFERMGMDSRLTAAVLRTHLQQLSGLISQPEDLLAFARLTRLMCEHPGVHYQGQTAPICAVSGGVILATPRYLMDQKVDILYLVDAHEIPTGLVLAEFLQPGEALMLRQGNSGTQSELAWFRGLVANLDVTNYYSRNAGLPAIERCAVICLMPKKKWESTIKTAKLARHILDAIRIRVGDEIAQITAWDHGAAKGIAERSSRVLGAFGRGSQLAAWKLVDGQSEEPTHTLLDNIWADLFNGPFMRQT